MITVDNVISINNYTEFAGSNQIDPAGIVYLRPNPEDSTQTLLYEEQLGSQEPRRWVIDQTLANVVTNTNTDAGYDVVVSAVLVLFMEEDEFAGETWSINPSRIFEMRDNVDEEAVIRLNSMNTQGLLEFVVETNSRDFAVLANGTIQQVENGTVDRINENELGEDVVIYWSTRLVEKDIPARTGFGGNTTPNVIHIATFEAKTIEYSIVENASS